MNTKRAQHKVAKIAHVSFRNGQHVIQDAREFAENTRDQLQDYYKDGILLVKKHPTKAVLAAVAIGLLLGKITR